MVNSAPSSPSGALARPKLAATVMRASPFVALALVLLGFGLAHTHDTDSLLYRQMARNVLASGDLWTLRWTDTQLLDFHDHLPPPIWLVAATENWLGAVGSSFAYAAMVFATWLVFFLWARRRLGERTVWLGIWVLAASEYYLRVQPLPRIDQPFLFLFVLSVVLAGAGRPAEFVGAGLAAGAAALFRPPIALALFALVPLSVLAHRRAAKERAWKGRADFTGLVVFLAAAGLLPCALWLASRAAGHADLWQRYLLGQVWDSLTGARDDGNPSHWAPWVGLARTFWPGLPLALAGLWATFRSREPWPLFGLVWALCIPVGLSLGRRHLPYHAWAAYPGLILLAGSGAELLVAKLPERLRRLGPWLGLSAALAFAIAFPFVRGPSRCDLLRAKPLLASARGLCSRAFVVAQGGPYWKVGHAVVDHLGFDVVFAKPDDPAGEAGCDRLVVQPVGLSPPPDSTALLLGNELSLFRVRSGPASLGTP